MLNEKRDNILFIGYDIGDEPIVKQLNKET
jgi:hypothetical protein